MVSLSGLYNSNDVWLFFFFFFMFLFPKSSKDYFYTGDVESNLTVFHVKLRNFADFDR